MNRIRSALLAFLGFVLASPLAHALTQQEAAKQLESLDWYTEDYPPYNFEGKDGKPTGMAIDILMEAFKRLEVGIKAEDIKIVPWNRSYKYIQTRPGTALFSMNQTPEREKIMQFVGPSIPSEVGIIAPKNRRVSISDESDLSRYNIGVVRDDIGDQLVNQLDINKDVIKRKNSLKQILFLLKVGKVDVVSYATDVFLDSVKRSGGNSSEYEVVYSLRKGHMGYAFHQAVDPEVLAPLQQTIDELRAEGVIDRIIQSYR